MANSVNDIIDTIREQDEEVSAEIYTDLQLKKNLSCFLMAVNPSAVFLILSTSGMKEREAVIDAGRKLCLGPESYFFVINEAGASFYDEDNDAAIPVDDLYEAFFNLYFAVVSGNFSGRTIRNISLADLLNGASRSYQMKEERHLISENRLAAVRTAVSAIQKADSSISGKFSKYRVLNGVTYVQKMNIFGEYQYYPIADINPDEFYRKVLFYGAFGIHKFLDGQVLKGILYAATAGFLGVFWAADVLSILLGNYRFKDGSYLGAVKDKRKVWMLFPAGIAINLALVFFWVKAGGAVFQSIQRSTQNAARNALNDPAVYERVMERIQKGSMK